jgi:hypothetical protein
LGNKCTRLDYPLVTKEMRCGVKSLKNHIIFCMFISPSTQVIFYYKRFEFSWAVSSMLILVYMLCNIRSIIQYIGGIILFPSAR